MMEATFVVVGGGIAGISCIEGLNILRPEQSVILISATSVVKMVSKTSTLTNLLAEFTVENKSYKRLYDIHPSLKIILDTVVSVNYDDHTVRTSSDRVIKYKKLCLCTGAVPKLVIPDNDYVIGIRDTDSVDCLQKKLESAKRVVVIGNGGIANEIVYESEGVDIIWVIKDKYISSTYVDPGAAEFFQDSLNKTYNKEGENKTRHFRYSMSDKCEAFMPGAAVGPDWRRNVSLHGGSSAKKFELIIEYDTELQSVKSADQDVAPPDTERFPVYAILTNGKVYGCDFVISATGVVPNTKSILLENGVKKFDLGPDGGINVNWKMETNVADIYAAGDVCTAAWDKAAHWLQIRLWTQARQMGWYVAKSMLCAIDGELLIQDFCFELFAHITRFFGYKVVLLGLFNGQTLPKDECELMVRVTKGVEYVKLVLLNGRLQGAVLVGETDLEEMCENLILNQLDLSDYGQDLLNPNIDIEDYFD